MIEHYTIYFPFPKLVQREAPKPIHHTAISSLGQRYSTVSRAAQAAVIKDQNIT